MLISSRMELIVLIICLILFVFLLPTKKINNFIEDIARKEAAMYSPRVEPNGRDIIEITIENGVAIVSKPIDKSDLDFVKRQGIVLNFINSCLERYNFTMNRTILVGLEDIYRGKDMGIFVFSRKEGDVSPLIPDVYAMQDYFGNFRNQDLSEKTKGFIFAGSTTGSTSIDDNERIKFCNEVLDDQEIDSFVTSIVQIPESEIEKKYPRYKEFVKKHIPQEEQMQYKYIISIDGNSTAWDRVPWVMNSKSVLVKKNSDMENWYYPLMKDGVQYISFNDFKDIKTKTSSIDNNYIVSQANKFVQDYLIVEQQMYYMFKMLENL